MAWHASPRTLLEMLACALLVGGATPTGAWATAHLIDDVARGNSTAARGDTIVLVMATLALAVGTTLSYLIQNSMNRRLVRVAKFRLFSAVNRIPHLSQFENPDFHNELRVAQQVGIAVPQQVSTALFGAVGSAVTITGLATVLARSSPAVLLALALLAVPAIFAAIDTSNDRTRTVWRTSSRFRREMFYAGLMTEPQAAQEVRLLGLRDVVRDRMRSELEAVDREEVRLDRKFFRHQGLLSWLAALLVSATALLAARSALSENISIGTMALIITSATGFQLAVAALIDQLADTHQALSLFTRFQQIVEESADWSVADPPATAAAPPLRQGISVRSLRFTYPGANSPVFDGLDLDFAAGQTTALVGLNGAGKSTLVKLLCGLYAVDAGSIRWDGTDIRKLDPSTIQERISVVFQNFMQYELSVRDNIGFGRVADLGDDNLLLAAAERAGASGVVEELPAGLDTMLSRTFFDEDDQLGVTLSGGQWQRLALSRAFMRICSDVVILDEPSSGLDAEAEADVHHRLASSRAARTNILISHRLSTVRHADHIYVLGGGGLVESGDHRRLMELEGEYFRLFSLQASGYLDDAIAEPAV